MTSKPRPVIINYLSENNFFFEIFITKITKLNTDENFPLYGIIMQQFSHYYFIDVHVVLVPLNISELFFTQ